MGKVRAKAKKSSSITHREDGSGEEEKLPAKRRGRPTKAQKEEEAEKLNESSDSKHEASLEIGNKRKKQCSQDEESLEMVEDENGVGPKTNSHELTKAAGFRHNGSRRKNKPQRAAEVGVSVCEVCSWLVMGS
nr:hypothetical protein [Tanacetum cinerariifolium]